MTAAAVIMPATPAAGKAPSKTPALDALEPKQRAFVRNFLIDFNGTAAAKRAGYSQKTATAQASQLLSKLNIRAAVDELMLTEAGVSRSRILQELARVGFGDIGKVADVDDDGNFSLKPFSQLDEDAKPLIASIKQKPGEHGVEREIKLHDKVAALNILAKATGLLKDAPTVAIQNNVNVGVMMAPAVACEDDWEALMDAERENDAEKVRAVAKAVAA